MVGYSPMQTCRFMPDETSLDLGFSRTVEATELFGRCYPLILSKALRGRRNAIIGFKI